MDDQASPFLYLPEDWISKIISLTSPKDACRAAAVSPALKSAAESDDVWEQFLPPDYGEILSGILSPIPFSTKKELYFMLCDSHLLLRGGKMSFKLDKLNGKKIYMLAARDLHITWGGTPMYWRWTSLPESRFGEVAELLSVCWLDIHATLRSRILTPNTDYTAYLVFKLSEDHDGLQWPSMASVAFRCQAEGEITNTTTVSVAPPRVPGVNVQHRLPSVLRARRIASRRGDGWMEVCLGEFFVEGGNECDVRIRVWETERLNWKKGLIVEGIEVRPKKPVLVYPH